MPGPTPPSPHQLARRLIAQETRALGAALTHANVLWDAPPADSKLAADRAWISTQAKHEQLSAVLGAGKWLTGLTLTAASEFAQGLDALFVDQDRILPIPAFAISRLLHDSVIDACWVADTRLPVTERLARCGARWLQHTQGGVPVAEQFPLMTVPAERRAEYATARSGAQDLLVAAGFEIAMKGPPREAEARQVGLRNSWAQVEPKVQEQANALSKDVAHIHSLTSGAAHSRSWLVGGLEGSWAEITVAVLVPLLDLSDLLADHVLAYVGHSPDQLHRDTHRRRLAAIQLADPSDSAMGDYDLYRRRRP